MARLARTALALLLVTAAASAFASGGSLRGAPDLPVQPPAPTPAPMRSLSAADAAPVPTPAPTDPAFALTLGAYCPDGNRISSQDECRQAAGGLGLIWSQPGDFGTFAPGGCFAAPRADSSATAGSYGVVWNSHPTGAEQWPAPVLQGVCSCATPTEVCAPTAAPTPAPTAPRVDPTFTLQAAPCRSGTAISSEAECRWADVGFDWNRLLFTENNANRPAGCIVYDSRFVYWNVHPAGSARFPSNARAVCVSYGTPAPAPAGWQDLGAGCCNDHGGFLFNGWLSTDLSACLARCAEFEDRCGFVSHGWAGSSWCAAYSASQPCRPHLHRGDGDCGSSGSNGVRSYRPQ